LAELVGPAHHKLGLTSKAMQDGTGITEPDYGVIFDDMVLESGCTVARHCGLLQPGADRCAPGQPAGEETSAP